jgi:hypothetical protein
MKDTMAKTSEHTMDICKPFLKKRYALAPAFSVRKPAMCLEVKS